MSKKRIAVIGGGLGSMTTIYNMLQLPGGRDKYEFTVYQLGWRLGGKGASGVNLEKGCRVEEHGIHFWFGFYENAFRMMKELYGALDRPKHAPLSTFDKAFKPKPSMTLTEHVEGDWVDWKIDLPELPGKLGDGKFNDPVEEIFVAAFNYLSEELKKYLNSGKAGCLGQIVSPFLKKVKRMVFSPELETIVQGMEKEIEDDVIHDIEKHLKVTGKLLSNHKYHGEQHLETHKDNLDHLKKWIWDAIGDMVEKDTMLRRVWQSIDFGLAMTRGMLNDGVVTVKDGKLVLDFTVINQYDYYDWICMHGADPKYMRDFPALKSMYDGPFAFFRGNVRAPNVEAGTALNIFLRLAITCKENIVWAMQAGMGDTIFAPMYELFKKDFSDNVKFEFFHKATHLKLDDKKEKVTEIEFEKQVKLKDGKEEYEPLYEVNDLKCWTSAPLYDQLDPEQAKFIQENNINLESAWSGWDQGETVVKKLGEDYDEVLVGASLASLPDFCSELIEANPKWGIMFDKVGTVQTQAFQIWLNKSPKELDLDPHKFLTCYTEPLDTFAEMNQILPREDWSKYPTQPKTLFYVCGAFEDSNDIPPHKITSFPANQKAEVYENMLHYMKNSLQHVIPELFDAEGNLHWDYLYDPTNGSGEDRLKYQYWRCNIDGSERYVFSLADSSRHRLKTDESGFANVWLTGDWINNGFNIGFVEGAVVSGMQSAIAISGEKIPIYLPW
jgi:uncharacterized protein with NAD-binding domain and iron-sulfur cluster